MTIEEKIKMYDKLEDEMRASVMPVIKKMVQDGLIMEHKTPYRWSSRSSVYVDEFQLSVNDLLLVTGSVNCDGHNIFDFCREISQEMLTPTAKK